MTRLAAIALLVLTGCMQDVAKLFVDGPPAFENRSAYPDKFFLQVWSGVEQLSKTEISLDGMTLVIHEDAGDFSDACPDIEGLGCSDYSNINIRGSVGTNFVDVGTEVAHQLGHVHFWQTENGDGRHAHAEWFGEGGYVEQARALLEAGAIQ